MDSLTAIAFAHVAFEALHPPSTWRPEFKRYVSPAAVGRDANKNYVVTLGWQPKSSQQGAEAFFEVHINAWTGKTTVRLDTPIDKYRNDELEEYL